MEIKNVQFIMKEKHYKQKIAELFCSPAITFFIYLQ